jgi:hypothetical protein
MRSYTHKLIESVHNINGTFEQGTLVTVLEQGTLCKVAAEHHIFYVDAVKLAKLQYPA